MGIISNQYIKQFVHRYDKEVGIPYYSVKDFKDLHQECNCFTNSKGIEIHYFYYYYDNFKTDKIILFLHGIGPGHSAYLAEIECLARRGYKVLTLDYTGCEESKGKYLGSLNNPTVDAIDLLNHLNLKEKIVVMGHSLGGYTSLNVVHLSNNIDKAIILSGFLSVESLLRSLVKSKFVVSRILNYEKKTVPEYFDLGNVEYLKSTKDKIMFIQSLDDSVVPYSISSEVVKNLNNPSLKVVTVNNRKHNPNYTDEAVAYMTEVFSRYNTLIKQKKIKTDEDKINYFKDVSLKRLTIQDEKIFDDIVKFIEE